MSKIIFKISAIFIFFIFELHADNKIIEADWSGDKFIVKFAKKPKNLEVGDLISKKNKKFIHSFALQNVETKGLSVVRSSDSPSVKISKNSKKDISTISFNHDEKLDISWKLQGQKLIFYIKEDKSKKKEINDKRNKQSKIDKIVNDFIDEDFFKPKRKKKKQYRKFIVTLDPGHGGKDPGAICKHYKQTEKDIVLDVAQYAKRALERKGFIVKMTRDSDRFIELTQRTQIAINNNSDIFVSIHVNSIHKTGNFRRKNGIETFFLAPARSERSKRVAMKENSDDLYYSSHYGKTHYVSSINHMKIIKSHRLAIDMQSRVVRTVKNKFSDAVDDGISEAPFWVLVGAQMPAVLIELGYIAGNKDGFRLQTSEYQRTLADGIANGVEQYFKYNF